MALHFEWDPKKAAASLARHDVSFPEAVTAFADPWSITVPDPDHGSVEARFLLLGHSERDRLLVVARTERGDSIHLISARQATRRERTTYEKDR